MFRLHRAQRRMELRTFMTHVHPDDRAMVQGLFKRRWEAWAIGISNAG